ncbi:hypothetical protein [Mycobacterium sherrisii]|uniref:Uncharacterized protein n=1 Tax=Mycobacterium sherrisii TaxID=243061 RepID=A0A1E3SV49_9MYCO|nr:hypothetical protein [Mycobacterium sherrisii]MCV7032046.1 hypothetical protein [Mycobacterium sherrisii]MEC4764043.1 hypothetical protein [Mycobacterium sherrisii]ODR06031.1 hypothetical protein BHQ21_12360 [Mycobacterium sherrisii]ORW76698.1 hypothetical protein AWC25_11165 [Mycobacterium sherrisii]
MRQATFKMVAAGDGSPPTAGGYCYYLVAHAVATVLLLLTLVVAVWQFMDWVVAPSCAEAGPQPSAASLAAQTIKATEIRDGAGQPGVSYRSWTQRPASYRDAARMTAMAGAVGCPCP